MRKSKLHKIGPFGLNLENQKGPNRRTRRYFKTAKGKKELEARLAMERLKAQTTMD